MNVTDKAQILKKLPSWVYKIAAQTWIDKEYPRHLFIETTATCNLTCNYCPRQKLKQDMDYGIFKQIVDEASEYGARSFSLHLFGEPLLYSHIFECIEYIKNKNNKHTVIFTTNGTLLEAKIDMVIKSRIDLVLWSYRKEARFSDKTKSKLRDWGKFRVRFIKEVTPPEAFEEWKQWPNIEHRSLHNYGGNISLTDMPYANAEKVTGLETRHPCYHLWLAPAVAWNGEILICCADPKREDVLGKFPEMSVHQAWKSPKLQEIRESHLRGEYKGICKDCDIWKQYPDLFFKWQKR